MSKSVTIVDAEDGSIVNWQVDLKPEMLTKKGLILPTAIAGVKVRYGREYVIGKLRHDVVETLGIESTDELILVMTAAIAN